MRFALHVLIGVSLSSAASGTSVQPTAIRFSSLLSDGPGTAAARAFESALSSVGMVAVTDIPGFSEATSPALAAAYNCMVDSGLGEQQLLSDGTHRLSFATKSPSKFVVESEEPACSQFRDRIDPFRELVDKVSTAFVARLDSVFETTGKPLLRTAGDAARTFNDVQSVISNGEQLEHIHSYQRSTPHTPSGERTIDLHTDQGLFIAFTPALLLSAEGLSTQDRDSFRVRLSDGTDASVEFPPNSLIFMAGDAMDGIVNPGLAGNAPIRATPHAVSISSPNARLWYGRMFLPPADALSERHGVTFSRLRELAAEQTALRLQSRRLLGGSVGDAEIDVDVGCSSQTYARRQAPAACTSNQMYCWMRCMELTPQINATACAEKGLQLQCTSQFKQVWREKDSHGDYNPTCSDYTDFVTPAPTLAPAPKGSCAPFNQSYAADLADGYKLAQLFPGRAVLLHKVVGDNIALKLYFNGRAGWLGLGIENLIGGHGGMLGAPVVLALLESADANPDDNFAALKGVREYIIDQKKTAFRWWSKPFSPAAIQQTSFEQSGDMCVTKFAFTSSSIAGAKLNTTGWNRLIWAVNKATAYPGYHTEGLRGHVTIDFSSGAILPRPTNPPSAPTPTAAPTAKAGVFSDSKTTSGTVGTAGVRIPIASLCTLVLATVALGWRR